MPAMYPSGAPSILELKPGIVKRAAEYVDKGLWKDKTSVIPTVEGLAIYLDVSRQTLYDRKEFSDTLEKIQKLQAQMVLNYSLAGKFNPTISKLLLSKHGYVEKTAQDITSNGETVGQVDPAMAAGYADYLKTQTQDK